MTGTADKPEDGDPAAAYAVLAIGDQMKAAGMQRVPYEVPAAVKTVRASGLPVGFADPLEAAKDRSLLHAQPPGTPPYPTSAT